MKPYLPPECEILNPFSGSDDLIRTSVAWNGSGRDGENTVSWDKL